jgi:hypothetical protein
MRVDLEARVAVYPKCAALVENLTFETIYIQASLDDAGLQRSQSSLSLPPLRC